MAGGLLDWAQFIYGLYRGNNPKQPKFSAPPLTPQQQKLFDLYINSISSRPSAEGVYNASADITNGYQGLNWKSPKTSTGETGYAGGGTPHVSPVPHWASNPTVPTTTTGTPQQPTTPSSPVPAGGLSGSMGGAPQIPNMAQSMSPGEVWSWLKQNAPQAIAGLTGPAAAGFVAIYNMFTGKGGQTPQLPSSDKRYPQDILKPGGGFQGGGNTDSTDWQEYWKEMADKGMDNSQAASYIGQLLGSQDSYNGKGPKAF